MIDTQFKEFLDQKVLPLTELNNEIFWEGFSELIERFSPLNQKLLLRRVTLQKEIDHWHRLHKSEKFDQDAYEAFLRKIGYLMPEGGDFNIETNPVDDEITKVAGPQLVVPLKNARFALNAANARWGSLYDSLYGTDVIPQTGATAPGQDYNPTRGNAVIAYGRDFLDSAIPLLDASHKNVSKYEIFEGKLQAKLQNGDGSYLQDASQLVAFEGTAMSPTALLFLHNGLHIKLCINPDGAIGRSDSCGIDDIVLEAAITTIMDCEDSVAAVDVEDKIEVYQNWLGLMRGTLTAEFSKNGQPLQRRLNPAKVYQAANGGQYCPPTRSLLFNRNVGLLMNTEMILDSAGQKVPEHLVDGVVTALISMVDLQSAPGQGYGNSKTGSIYIVKPKMHGPDEVAFVCDLFTAIEELLNLPINTIKLGIMDEERRTTVNLKECIRQARHRLVFINTGFLDRTGDEIHTSMEAGPFLPKDQIKQQPWISAYENRNVDIGLECGLSGKAQIGKGMWPMPDEMAAMMSAKVQHPLAGANTSWVPSPTAAVLHALHYHQVNVFHIQASFKGRKSPQLRDVLTIPLIPAGDSPSESEIENELRNNIQGILGYVVRWVEAGVGCSKVPDVHNVSLMEDRATLRISAKHVANWLHHGLCSKEQIENILLEMAAVVDQQNLASTDYFPMTHNTNESMGFQSARKLIFQSGELPNGYTEPVLHDFRRRLKATQA
ncbi:MAG: malate synthase G [Pseudohongiellaceae bacterium]